MSQFLTSKRKRGGNSWGLQALVEWAAMKDPADSSKNARSKNASPNAPPAEPAMFGAHTAQPEPRNWVPLIVGFGLVLAVLVIVAVMGHGKKEVATTADPYSPMLVVAQATLSQADNFVGSTITYIDLTVRNTGDRTVVGGTVQAVFRDSLGEAVQTETVPLRALIHHPLGGEDEAGDLALAPLAPGQTRVLRLTIEHISSQWNQAQPELEFRGLRFK
jgi:hypothetical protein